MQALPVAEAVVRAKPYSALRPQSRPAGCYRPRDPTQSPLFEILSDELNPFLRRLAEQHPDGSGLPAHVERELRSFLECGLPEFGFALLQCDRCSELTLVPFSCKSSFCPSCCGRRMLEVAANLVDRLLPFVPYRQLVLSFPMPVARLLARRPRLLSKVRNLFFRAVRLEQRLAARRAGIRDAHVGMVCLTQRFTSQLLVFPHFHAIVPDGVFVPQPDGSCVFSMLPKMKDADVERLLRRVIRRVLPLVDGALQDDPPQMSCLDWGEDEPRDRRPLDPEALQGRLCARLDGFSLHAARRIHQNDRAGLEALLQYALRPPISDSNLSRLPDGRVRLRLKRQLKSGVDQIVLTPFELLRRISAFLPQPGIHEIHYFGVFASHAALRPRIVPRSPRRRQSCASGSCNHDDSHDERQLTLPMPPLSPALRAVLDCTFPPEDPDELAAILPVIKAACPRPVYIPWADLLKRVHGVDLLACPCGGRRRIVAFVNDRKRVIDLLDWLGARPRPQFGSAPAPASRRPARPPRPPPRRLVPEGQLPLAFATSAAGSP